MANNRMYLVNRRTGHRIYLAKYYPSTGWYLTVTDPRVVDDAFFEADFGHLSAEEREAKRAQRGFGAPYSLGGMLGDEWVLEYEARTPEA